MLNINHLLCGIIILSISTVIFVLMKYKNYKNKSRNYLANITHDLKSPTSAQINMIHMLLDGYFGELNPRQSEMLKLMCGVNKYIFDLVGTILASYKCESSKIVLKKSYFNLNDLVNSICLENKYRAYQKNQHIIFAPQKEMCIIYADKLQIERVISNLLSNAINYGFENSDIKITVRETPNCTKFSIINKSFPIPKYKLKKIFERFSGTDNSSLNKYSTGLGLYVSKKIIDLHNGKIYAKSLNDGTCIFGFKLFPQSGLNTQNNSLTLKFEKIFIPHQKVC